MSESKNVDERGSAKRIISSELLEQARAAHSKTTYPNYYQTIEFVVKNSPIPVQTKKPEICDSVLEAICGSPMIRLKRFAAQYDWPFELLGKCDFLLPGGSLKDRIGLQMLSEWEAEGRIKPGDTLIEATSGNTGIALSMVAAVKGYKMLITMPEKMSQEKSNVLNALGAEITRTPTEAAWDAPNSHISLAYQLANILPRAHVLDQYMNPGNPRAHYFCTAEEILEQCDGHLDWLFVSSGTGGSLTGIATKIKERCPNCTIVGVDPHGSILAQPEYLNTPKAGQPYLIEGIGYDFIPPTLNRNIVDRWVKVSDKEAFIMARELIRTEGLLIGGSCGSNLAALKQLANEIKKGQRCVVLLPDSSRNYISKFIDDQWMILNQFYPPKTVSNKSTWTPKNILPLKPSEHIKETATIEDVLKNLHKTEIFLVKNDQNESVGICNSADILKFMTLNEKSLVDCLDKPLKSLTRKDVKKFNLDVSMEQIGNALHMQQFCILQDQDGKEYILTAKDFLKSVYESR